MTISGNILCFRNCVVRVGNMSRFLHLPHARIDKQKWDTCLDSLPVGNVYALSWYLDAVSPGWEAIVMELHHEYQVIMPLPVKQKWGFRYLSQPPYCQQLGVFFRNGQFNVSEFDACLQVAFLYYKHVIAYSFNGLYPAYPDEVWSEQGITYQLSLNRPYAQLTLNYSNNRQRNLRKGLAGDFKINAASDIEILIDLFCRYTAPQIKGGFSTGQLQAFRQLYRAAKERNLTAYWVVADTSGEVVAAALFIKYRNKLIYLFPAASPAGKKAHAPTLLIDAMIRRLAGTDSIFDFEGSKIPGIAHFYASFGSEPIFFPVYKQGSWPVYLKLVQQVRQQIYSWLFNR